MGVGSAMAFWGVVEVEGGLVYLGVMVGMFEMLVVLSASLVKEKC
jgi:hypothetical protein